MIQPADQPTYTPPQGQSYQPPINPETDPEMIAGAHSHARSLGIVDKVVRALGGPHSYKAITNPDGSVDVHEMPSTRGEQWTRIAQAALAGAARGMQVGQGPGGLAHAAAAGIGEGLGEPQAHADQVREQADKANDQNQKKLLFNANMAMLDQKIITAKNQNQRDGVLFPLQVQQASLAWAKALRDAGAVRSTSFKDNEEMSQQLTPENLNAHLGTNGIFIPQVTYKNNMADGVDGWILPEDKRQQLNDKRIEIPRSKPDPDNPGKFIPDDPYVIEPRSMVNENIAATVKGIHDQQTEMVQRGWTAATSAKEAADKAKLVPSQIAQNVGAAAASGAEAKLRNVQADLAPQALDIKEAQAIAQQQKQNLPNFRAHDRLYVQPAEQAEQSFQMADNAYKEFEAARKQGKKLPTGAQSMQLLAQHMGTTFGSVKGTRQTKSMIEQHIGARGITDDAVVAWNKIVNGDELSPKQWTAFHDMIGQARQQKWATAAREAPRYGIPTDFLPPDLKSLAGAQPGAGQAAIAPGTPAPAPAPAAGGFDWNKAPKVQ
jgi:hypothetical protein